MDDLVEKVATAIEPYLDYETGTDDSKDSAARAAVIATLEALADEYDAMTYTETYEGSEGPYTMTFVLCAWHTAASVQKPLSEILRERAQSLVK